jgi:hypothetical protein
MRPCSAPVGVAVFPKEPAMKTKPLFFVLAAAVIVAAAGCAATQPFSQLDGYRWNKAGLDTFDVTIISVDGEHYIQRGTPIMITPGQHKIVVQGPSTAGFRYGAQRTLELNVEPCTRYWLEARKENALQQDFTPAVNYSDRISGCPAG